MLELLLDTSHAGLHIGLVKDNKLIDTVTYHQPRKQSEMTMPLLGDLFKKNNVKPLELDGVCITIGPGSFTGLRIAMTIAKVLCSMEDIKLYTINTLLAYVHPDKEKSISLMDARSKRAYFSIVDKGEYIIEPEIIELINFDYDLPIFGDAHLVEKESEPFSIIENILAYKDKWNLVEDVDALVPFYLKENESYGH